ncbi:hypothetical protein ACLHDG_05430 [Sulfurovum sp. CS9]|uniref:hypothetical protein n=1 Tax=Sulfurovum sp. CS9 TaxID=3391146 RepID=UPI0039E786A6
MKQKFPEPVVRKRVEKDTHNEYSLLNVDSTGKVCRQTGKPKKRMMTIRHNPCAHTYTLDIYEFMNGKRRCGKCKGKALQEKNAEKIEVIKLKTQALTDGEYSFVDDHYTNSKTKHFFVHHACGTVFEKKWEKFKGTPKQAAQRCPMCVKKGMESGASRYVRDIFDDIEVDYVLEKRFDDCINPETGNTLPFDYYLPQINTLIEIDGEQHERGSFSKYASEGIFIRDEIKNRYAEDNGIELVRIPAKKWSQLPEILHAILSKDLLKTLTRETVKSITHSTHPERINKDLQKIHNGTYALHDSYYFGVDRRHNFIHHECGTVFEKTLSTVRSEEMPCPTCKRKVREKHQHDVCNTKLIEKTKGRYSLDNSRIGCTKENKRLVHCHECSQSWYSLTANIIRNNGGCPNCNHKRRSKSA